MTNNMHLLYRECLPGITGVFCYTFIEKRIINKMLNEKKSQFAG